MAYFYGNETGHWWGYGNVTTSNQSGSVTRVTLTAGMQARGWGFDISYVDATATVSGQSATTYDNDFYSPTGGYAAVDMVTKTLDITRDHSAKTVNVSIKVVNRSSYMDGTSTASSTVTIPARASYSVSYNANGGTGAPSAQTKWHDETLTLSTTKPTRSGYSFQGWATSSGGKVAYASGASYTANSAVTLYAIWAASSWTVAYNANGGTSTPASQTKNYNVDLTLRDAITHSNTSVSYTVTYDANGGSSTGATNNKQTATTTTTWTFANWKSSADKKTYAAKGKYSLNAATTMTAQWSTSSSGGTVTLPTPTRAGHNFNGWYDGNSRVGGAGGSYKPTANVTLKASWTIQTWTVQYDANFGAGAPSAQTKTYGQTLKLSSTQPRRSGYTFLGWATASDGTGTAYSPNGNYTANAAATLYAVWIAVQVTSVSGYRCESDGTKADSGTYGHIEASCRALGTIAGVMTVMAEANDSQITVTPSSGSKEATYDLTISPTSTFGEYDASTSITVMVSATFAVSYGGTTRAVTAQRGMVIPKPFRIMDFVHGSEYDGFTEGAAIGSVATLVGRFEVALMSVFNKTVDIIQSSFGRDEELPTPTDGNAPLRFRDRAGLILGYLNAHKNPDGTNYVRLTGVGPDSGLTANVYLGSDGTRKRIGTDAKWTSNLQMESTGMGLDLVDSTGTAYKGITDNGSNLWIGANSSTERQHVGQTYISSGHNGTKGNETIYIAVPNAANTGATGYAVYHSGYKPTPAGIGALALTGGTLTGGLVIKDSRFDRDGSVSSETWSLANEYRDKDGDRFGGLQAFQTASGVNAVRLQVFAEDSSGTAINNAIDVRIDRSGNKTYAVSNAANFRAAIGAAAGSEYYASLSKTNCSGGSIVLYVRGKVGVVILSGVKINTISARSTFATVPSGYRPAGQRYGYINGHYAEYLIVNDNGTVQGDSGLSGQTIWGQVMFEIV